jgi:microcystin-dependent protein
MPLDATIGQIMPLSFASPQNIPKGWHLCDGSLLPIAQNQALFSLLGNRFGGDGRVTFGLPDLRGRAILGGTGPGVGPKMGSETVSLTEAQIPSHSHTLAASTTVGSGRPGPGTGELYAVNTSGSPPIAIFGVAGSAEVPLADDTNITVAGNGSPHSNMQPYLAINYVIALTGVYPSRL